MRAFAPGEPRANEGLNPYNPQNLARHGRAAHYGSDAGVNENAGERALFNWAARA
jgi:hypothetical protein